MVKVLLGREANKEACSFDNIAPVHRAAQLEKKEAFRLLYQIPVEGYSSQLTPLYMAIENNHTEIVKILLNHGANVNHEILLSQSLSQLIPPTWLPELQLPNIKKEGENMTLLQVAVPKGNIAIIQLLLSRNPMRYEDFLRKPTLLISAIHTNNINFVNL